MKKMSTLFLKNPENLGRVTDKIDPNNMWVFEEGVKATRKLDGTSCAIIEGKLYKRYDAKPLVNAKSACVGDIVAKKSGKPFPDGLTREIVAIHKNDPSKRHNFPNSRQKVAEFSDGSYQSLKYLKFANPVWAEIPDNAIPCCEPDPKSGHWPHWVPCIRDNPADKYHWEAFDKLVGDHFYFVGKDNVGYNQFDGSYELCGPKIQKNPEGFDSHVLVRHGSQIMHGCTENLKNGLIREFEYFTQYLSEVDIEGIVFHGTDGKMCKLRKSDFGIKRNKS